MRGSNFCKLRLGSVLGAQKWGRGMTVNVQVGIRGAVQGTKSLACVLSLRQLLSGENIEFVAKIHV